MFIFSISNSSEFAFFSQIANISKLNIKTIHYWLAHLNIDSIIKSIFKLIGIKTSNRISKFFCGTYVFSKQVKQIPKNSIIKALISEKRIYLNLGELITLIWYDKFKYRFLLIDDRSCILIEVLFKNKCQVKV